MSNKCEIYYFFLESKEMPCFLLSTSSTATAKRREVEILQVQLFFCNQESENVAQQINGKEDEKRMRAVKLNKLRSLQVFFLFQISNEKVKAPLMMNL